MGLYTKLPTYSVFDFKKRIVELQCKFAYSYYSDFFHFFNNVMTLINILILYN